MAATEVSLASRRMPLASVPHAVNSPIRAGAAVKRSRTHAEDAQDLVQTQPPAKRQMLEIDQENIDPRAEHGLTKVDDQFPKRSSHTQPTPLERKLAASREKRSTAQQSNTRHVDAAAERQSKINAENLESIRQWQRHYRRQFPSFVFYMDCVPDDVRQKCGRQLRGLEAREEMFFSNAVTHVVTTRPIPDRDASQSARSAADGSATDRKTASTLDIALQRRIQDADTRRLVPQTADILVRAQALNIKTWPLEKFQRILKTMFEAETGEQEPSLESRITTAVASQAGLSKTVKDAELKKLLRHDQIAGDAHAQEMVTFKGYYIYVHDMDERTRPVMARDYSKPAVKTDGKWPQFHVTAQGRCPFVEDQSYVKNQHQEKEALNPGMAKAYQQIMNERKTRAAGATREKHIPTLGERSVNLRRSPRKSNFQELHQSKPLDPPKLIPTRRTSQEEVPLFANIQNSSRALPKMIGGMPVASGLQHSNVTSAIRSQVVSSTAISSTAPGMGRRVTDSKEITALKRKVLERGASTLSQPPSSYINDMRAAINDESAAPPTRAAKRKAQESILGVVPENGDTTSTRQKTNTIKKRKSERDPKPGYCENCHDKFDDFDEHIASRKHQKFARTAEHFKELDALLAQLKRPHKAH